MLLNKKWQMIEEKTYACNTTSVSKAPVLASPVLTCMNPALDGKNLTLDL